MNLHPDDVKVVKNRILRLLSQGYSNKEIAAKTGLNIGNVSIKIRALYAAHGIKDWGNKRVRLANKIHRFVSE